VIITATGRRPVVAGKPETPLHAEAVARSGARNPLVVGDRLDTDIEGAVRGGADSMLVLTGVTSPRDAVLAPPGRRPTYLAAGLGGLLERQPAIGRRWENTSANADGRRAAGPASEADGSARRAFRCGGWLAWRSGGSGSLELTGHGPWIDGLRVLCAAAWSAGQVSPAMADPALAVLGQPS
jgi:glycerol-1-phosphatase